MSVVDTPSTNVVPKPCFYFSVAPWSTPLKLPYPPQLSVVDTPGTNVILERQQRLTEEFVPQADLILFVLSCDRALSDSEVRERSRERGGL